jgi:hypothetical protein
MESNEDLIYTTGALLRPQKVTDKLGNVLWMWTVAEFTEDSFKDGIVFNPAETAESLEALLIDTTAQSK